MPCLRVRAGPSLDDLTEVHVNSGKPVDVSGDAFAGQVAVFLKGFSDPSGAVSDSAYFAHPKRNGITWSIQMQGRWLKEYSADDILFGNVFHTPIYQPWGFTAAVRFMQYLDPTLEQDLASPTRPWALSPLVASMPYLRHVTLEDESEPPKFPPESPVEEDVGTWEVQGGRRAWFTSRERRKAVALGPKDLIKTDFAYNYISFSPSSVYVSLPGGWSIDLTRYWDGEPVKFVCCERKKEGDELPWGRVFWCVSIERVEDDETEGEAEKNKEVSVGDSDPQRDVEREDKKGDETTG